MSITRPRPSEFNSYYKHYIDLAKGESLLEMLESGKSHTIAFFKGIPESKHHFRYEEGKWTPKEILLHLIDTERVFTYRALHFARANNVVLPGFDQNDFVESSNANEHTMNDLLQEYEAVRTATITFAKSCSEETLLRMGTASNSPFSVRALLHVIVGHEIHHSRIISERYLKD